jgi:hypothetical protein
MNAIYLPGALGLGREVELQRKDDEQLGDACKVRRSSTD